MPSGIYDRQKYKQHPRSRSGLKGVIYHGRTPKKPWKAYIRQHGMYRTLGYFEAKEQAARAYDQFAKRFFGDEAFLNNV